MRAVSYVRESLTISVRSGLNDHNPSTAEWPVAAIPEFCTIDLLGVGLLAIVDLDRRNDRIGRVEIHSARDLHRPRTGINRLTLQ